MQGCEEKISRIADAFSAQRQNLEDMKSNESRSFKALEGLLASMQQTPDSFDKEDCSVVSEQLTNRRKSLDQIELRLRDQDRKREMNERVFSEMYKSIEKRRTVLEAVDDETSVLRDHPALLEKLAAKQANLEQLLIQKLSEVAAPGS